MKDLNSKYYTLVKIEFWVVTILFIFSVFFHISDALRERAVSDDGHLISSRGWLDYIFVSNLIRFTILYLAFLILNFRIVPRLLGNRSFFLHLTLGLLTFLLAGLIFGIMETYLKYSMVPGSHPGSDQHNLAIERNLLFSLLLLVGFTIYTCIRYAALYLLSRSEALQTKYKFITQSNLVAFIIWMMVTFFLVLVGSDRTFIAIWSVVGLSAIFLYTYSFYSIIPGCMRKRKPLRAYIARMIVILFITSLPLWLLATAISNDEEWGLGLVFFNGIFQLFIILPLTWFLFKSQMKGNEELFVLKTALGRSNANFDFLRSQINPHFLFNALNTIYGTAIQEKAERTSEGIEKLGDMMRFMLQENMQEKIPLSNEIDYLNNYISLQRLRTDTNPNVKIEDHLQQQVNGLEIAPMLLIPFVENAFKHGISLRESSHISITLEIRDRIVYFDVYNNKHSKIGEDPEKNKSGIGLNNVKQRLQLSYPGKHDLLIRETSKDFFVHLTLHLT